MEVRPLPLAALIQASLAQVEKKSRAGEILGSKSRYPM